MTDSAILTAASLVGATFLALAAIYWVYFTFALTETHFDIFRSVSSREDVATAALIHPKLSESSRVITGSVMMLRLAFNYVTFAISR